MAYLSTPAGCDGGSFNTTSLTVFADLSQIWSLPKLTLVYSTEGIATLQHVLVDSTDPPALSIPQDPPRKTQDLDIDQILIALLGESLPRPHLLVSLRHFYAIRDIY